LQGVVHASSATGQTVFVEPLETLDLNNRLVQLSEEETSEIARILGELTNRVTAERAALLHAVATVAELDSLFARARFAREFDACMPVFTDSAAISLEAARHPVLESTLRPQGRSVVPMTLSLGGDQTVLVISGPNTGGKTVALKTVCLAALAAQSGIPVAAHVARLPIFDQVLADIGDEQSIAADLSTC
jgi:DNA mismatch repair protein MutS2